MRVVVLCLLVCLVSVGSVFAIPITFDFAGESIANRYYEELSFSQDGLSLAVRAYLVDEFFSVEGAEEIAQTSSGLGVYTSGTDSGQLDDSFYKKELLAFSFSETVSLCGLGFVYGDGDDQFSLLVNGELALTPSVEESWENRGILLGSIFALSIVDNSDDWRIKSMTVDVAPVSTPEPSTFLLLGSGLIGLLFWRKRKSS